MTTYAPAKAPARAGGRPHKPRRPSRRPPSPARLASRVLVGALVVVQVYPLVWLFLTSLRTERDFAGGNPFALPTSLTFDNYARAFGHGHLGRNILNSLIVTMGANVLIVLCGMMGAYALQVLGFRFSRVVRALFLVGIVVPVQIALVPLFVDYTRVGLLDTYPSMILPLAGFALPMSVYLFSSFFEYIPREVYEAASLDGAGPYRIFARITLPMSVNTVVTVVMVNSIFIWNDFIFANTFVLSEDLKTIPLGLQNYIGAMGKTDWTATFAAVCVTVTPLLLIFLVLNRAMIYGLERGASKG
ncbi:carbohydrate ABC transporter permease [Actinomadura rayongensis]|uniref:ABC transporter permease subunit n=1 Tax=Actinomadura rayongensis TaxID=1429076 RepID=A0A6I4WHF8_9ACTN|nr:carbohydrate ABC transporter permease [Actinomadura rayongensis]MXQ68290.1 ABC transporter permease subunit [Actinomadura rayongensis]